MQATVERTFGALADPTRIAIIERLKRGPATLTEVGEPLDMTLPAVLKHIRVLEGAGLIVGRRRGRERHLTLRAGPLRAASSYLDSYRAFWEDRLDSLGAYLERADPKR